MCKSIFIIDYSTSWKLQIIKDWRFRLCNNGKSDSLTVIVLKYIDECSEFVPKTMFDDCSSDAFLGLSQ